MPNVSFESPITDIANHIGQEVYLKDFPSGQFQSRHGLQVLDRTKVMQKSPGRRIHGFDNATRSAALLPHLVQLLKKNRQQLPETLQSQLATISQQEIKALQVVALMRASGRHYTESITQRYQNNPDFGSGTNYACFGEQECLAMLHDLSVPNELEHKNLAHAIVGNEYVSDRFANHKDDRISGEHKRSKDDLYSLLLNVLNVLETTRDLSTKEVDLNWMPLFRDLGDKGKKDFIEFAKKHILFIKEHQGYLWTTTVIGGEEKQILISGDRGSCPNPKYTGKKFTDAKDMFAAIDANNSNDSSQKLSSAKNADDYYKYYTDNQNTGRWHFFTVKDGHSNLQGDALKSKILKEFKAQLEKTEQGELDKKIDELKKTTDYSILTTGQGIFTRCLKLKTTSAKAFEAMCTDFTINSPRK